MASINPASASTKYDEFGLGMSQTRFAELYGLGSDMEPVLMVYRLFLFPADSLIRGSD